MGLSVPAFYYLTPVEFFNANEEYRQEEERHYKEDMERMRIQTLYLVNIQLAKDSKITDPRELMKFEWDKPIEVNAYVPTDEEWETLQNFYGKNAIKMSQNSPSEPLSQARKPMYYLKRRSLKNE